VAHTNRLIGFLVNYIQLISYGTAGIMKKLFIVVMVISFCSIFLTSDSWAFWPFPLRPWKSDDQSKTNNLQKQLQDERQMNEDAQTKINDLENQLQYEKQLKESVQTKTGDLEKQLQVERQMNEDAQKDKAKAERSRSMWMYISAAVGLICLLLGIAIGSKIRRTAKS
jgi:septal ring factor EnvC (AmiA/AmiB activator)